MSAALVLAGERPGGDPLAREMGISHKALIEIEGKTLLERVIAALRDASVDPIAVSCEEGPVAELARQLGALVIASGDGPSASVAAAFDQLGAPMIVTTSDHALLEADWVRDLVAETPEQADLSLMLAERVRIERVMPHAKRTYLTFADGGWSGCNLFYLQTSTARRALDIWSMVEADRKRPWRIAARLGLGTLFLMLLRRLTLREGLSRLGKRAGVRAELIPARDGLAAVDVDKPSDLADVRTIIKQRERGTIASPD